jgi:hypothetical protein
MPDVGKIISGIRDALNLLFNNQTPSWLLRLVAAALLFGILLGGMLAILQVISKILDIVREKFVPLFYNAEKRRQAMRYRRFAKHVENEINRLDLQEEWKDYRFAELEAEVEAEGRRRAFPLLPFVR